MYTFSEHSLFHFTNNLKNVSNLGHPRKVLQSNSAMNLDSIIYKFVKQKLCFGNCFEIQNYFSNKKLEQESI